MPETREQRLEKRIQEDLQFIGGGNWPNWPFLPMKYHGKNPEFQSYPKNGGFIIDGNMIPRSRVYLDNFWALASGEVDLRQTPTKDYPTVRAMLEDGWMVD